MILEEECIQVNVAIKVFLYVSLIVIDVLLDKIGAHVRAF
jgi:hypothetical protein